MDTRPTPAELPYHDAVTVLVTTPLRELRHGRTTNPALLDAMLAVAHERRRLRQIALTRDNEQIDRQTRRLKAAITRLAKLIRRRKEAEHG